MHSQTTCYMLHIFLIFTILANVIAAKNQYCQKGDADCSSKEKATSHLFNTNNVSEGKLKFSFKRKCIFGEHYYKVPCNPLHTITNFLHTHEQLK